MRRIRAFLVALAVLGLVAMAAQTAVGCWAALSDRDLIIQSDLVVWGKITGRKGSKGDTTTATLTIKRVIKGDAKLTAVTFRFLTSARTSASLVFRGDEEAIWYLKKDSSNGSRAIYFAFYPTQYRTEKKSAEEIQAKIQMLRKLVVITAPRRETLAEALKQTLASGQSPRVFRIKAVFKKETARRVIRPSRGAPYTSTSVSWFLVDDEGVKVRAIPGRLLKEAERSAKTGRKLDLEVIARAYGAGAGLMVQMQVLRTVQVAGERVERTRVSSPPVISEDRARNIALKAATERWPNWRKHHRTLHDVITRIELSGGKIWAVQFCADNGRMALTALIRIDARTGAVVRFIVMGGA